MNLKQFLQNFNYSKPNWDLLPKGFPDCELKDLSSSEVGLFNSVKGLWELNQQSKPQSRSRVWKSPNGYIYLVAWANACLLRVLGARWWYRFRERQIKGYYRNLKDMENSAERSAGNENFYRNLKNMENSAERSAGNENFYRNLKDMENSAERSARNENFYRNLKNMENSAERSAGNGAKSSKILQNPSGNPKQAKGSYRILEEDAEGVPASLSPPPVSPKMLDRTEGQLLDAWRSVIANIEEGYSRPTTSQYLEYLGFSQGSLKETKGDIQRLHQEGRLLTKPGSGLHDLGINLEIWHEALKQVVISRPAKKVSSSNVLQRTLTNSKQTKGFYRTLEASTPFEPYKKRVDRGSSNVLQNSLVFFRYNYPPVDDFNPDDLSYEMLIELLNKTDWHLRRLVESLEKKLGNESKYYKVEKARVRGNLNQLLR